MSGSDIIPFEGPRELAGVATRVPALFLPEPKASTRFWEFFTANIRFWEFFTDEKNVR